MSSRLVGLLYTSAACYCETHVGAAKRAEEEHVGSVAYRVRASFDGRSGVLFARPSFIEGMARIFDFGGTLSAYNRREATEQADYLALSSDWYAVGNDMRHAAAIVTSGAASSDKG